MLSERKHHGTRSILESKGHAEPSKNASSQWDQQGAQLLLVLETAAGASYGTCRE